MSACSSSSVPASPTASATRRIVAGSARSRRTATSGSSRWCCDQPHEDGHASARRGRGAGRSSRTSSIPAAVWSPGVALAEIVEQRGEHEEVGAAHPVGERGGVGRGLPEVPIDGEAVVGVALRPAAHRRPLGQEAHEEAALVERLEHVDRAVPLAQQRHQLVEGAVGPTVVPCGGVDAGGEPVERGSARSGRRAGRPPVPPAGSASDPPADRRPAPARSAGRRPRAPRPPAPRSRPASARRAAPRAVGDPHDRPRRRGDPGHQLVG